MTASIYTSTWGALTNTISAALVASLAAAGEPPLTANLDGSPGFIKLGKEYLAEQLAPPRVVFVPVAFPMEMGSRSVATAVKGGINLQGHAQARQRAIAIMRKTFDVYCWGANFADQVTPASDPALDYDATEQLVERLLQAVWSIAAGQVLTEGGEIDPEPSAELVRYGRLFTFRMTLDTPVPDVPSAFAPSGVTAPLNVTFEASQ